MATFGTNASGLGGNDLALGSPGDEPIAGAAADDTLRREDGTRIDLGGGDDLVIYGVSINQFTAGDFQFDPLQ